MEKVGVFFTENLRVRDNTVLDAAIKSGWTIIPFYWFDKSLKSSTELGMRKIWPYRAKFLCESLQNLRKNLENLWSHLSVLRWNSTDDIVTFAKTHYIKKIYIQESVWVYEREMMEKLKNKLEENNIKLYIIWDSTLVHKDDLPFSVSELPKVYTHFRKAVEKQSQIDEPLPEITEIKSPEVETTDMLSLDDFGYDEVQIDSRRAIEFIGGEDAGLERVKSYLWDTQNLSTYKETRNGLIWANYSSKLSAWLNLGCISSRYVYSEVKKYEKQVKKNSSTYWLIFEILWRDFFQFVFLQNPMKFFHNYPDVDDVLKNETDKRTFEKWKSWNLWIPFVDANMKELKLTGFMSNRWRQNVASYLVNDLKLDWRLWAMYFESMLVDYDVAANWWNWAYQAWVGNDPRDNRYFLIEKQQKMYDPDGTYRKLWNI